MRNLNQLRLEKTLRAEIQNEFTGFYDKHWAGGYGGLEAYRANVTASHAASQTKYGVLKGEPVEFDFITTSAHAQTVLDWIVGYRGLPRTLINLIGDPSITEIERGDVIEFAAEESLGDALLGLVSAGEQFRVLDKEYLSNFKQQVRVVSIVDSGFRWVQHFDDNDWTAVNGSWNGVEWLPGGDSKLELAVAGTWADGYRPTTVRVTLSSGLQVHLEITAVSPAPLEMIYDNVSYTTGTEGTLGFDGVTSNDDIGTLEHDSAYHVTNIEFLEAT